MSKIIENFAWASPPENCMVYGLGIRHIRTGTEQIIPNIHSPLPMFMLIFNHDAVKVTIDGQEVEYAPDTLCIWDMKHRVYYGNTANNWRLSWLQFYPQVMEKYLERFGFLLNKPVKFIDDSTVYREFMTVCEEFCESSVFDPDIIENALCGILLKASKMISCGRKTIIVPPEFSALKNYIDNNFQRNLNLKGLAGRINLEPSYLSRKFKEYFGNGPIDYVIKLRLEKAAYLLKYTGMSVGECGARAGFQSLYHFSRIFKRNYKVSPSGFRTK